MFGFSKIRLFKKISKKRIFKLTVSTRKFYKKYTKFRRKSFNRLRHKNNWIIYINVFKFWSSYYLNSKNFYRKYWLMDSNAINYLCFNPNSLKNISPDLFNNFFIYSLSLNRFYNIWKNYFFDNLLVNFNQKNANLILGSFEKTFLASEDMIVALEYYDLQIYENLSLEKKVDVLSDYFLNYNNQQFLPILPLYQILIFIFS